MLVPASVEASAEGLSSTELIGRVNDGSRTTCYRAAFNKPVSISLSYDQPVSINTYAITSSKSEPTRDPAEWTLEGSNDGTTWTQLDKRSGQTFSQRYATQFYSADSEEAYSTYRLTVTATDGANQIQIGEIQMLSIVPSDPTGINCMHGAGNQALRQDGQMYNLSGQRVNDKANLGRGIYVKNGKKVVVKF